MRGIRSSGSRDGSPKSMTSNSAKMQKVSPSDRVVSRPIDNEVDDEETTPVSDSEPPEVESSKIPLPVLEPLAPQDKSAGPENNEDNEDNEDNKSGSATDPVSIHDVDVKKLVHQDLLNFSRKMPEWKQRFLSRRRELFSRFEQGIKLSDEMLYSVTPERIAKAIAMRLKDLDPKIEAVIDVCGGAGGNTIAFSRAGLKTYYVDINFDNLQDAVHNAHIYDVYDIEFLHTDVRDLDFGKLGSNPETTWVFASPEWGGPSYKSQEVFDTDTCTPRVRDIIDQARSQGIDRVAVYLPRTSDLDQLAELGATNIDRMMMASYNNRQRAVAIVAYWSLKA